MEESNTFKCEKCTNLRVDLKEQGYIVQFFAIKVGARLIGRCSQAPRV